jgi:hypothetical protein
MSLSASILRRTLQPFRREGPVPLAPAYPYAAGIELSPPLLAEHPDLMALPAFPQAEGEGPKGSAAAAGAAAVVAGAAAASSGGSEAAGGKPPGDRRPRSERRRCAAHPPGLPSVAPMHGAVEIQLECVVA